MKKEHRESWERNRFAARRPKKTKGWCDGCDRNIVEQGKKCELCGKRYKSNRDKK